MRNATKGRIEKVARNKEAAIIDLDLAEEGIAIGRQMMEEMIKKQQKNGGDGAS
jgi:hypothetical protein